ncbi:MAG: hypothetical protein ACRERE_33300 [Candidatus Entotheonellia bacterium]
MPPSSEGYSPELIQHLIDQAAFFNLFAIADPRHSHPAIYAPGDSNGVIGIRTSEVLHRFDIDLQLPSFDIGVRAINTVGEPVGWLDLRWMVLPHDFMARPDREPPPTLLDPSRSQRFAMQEGTFTFGDGNDGFHSFGAGRTFPMMVGGRPQLVAAAVGNISAGFGKFRGYEGNYTLCGTLSPDQGFGGHILVRIVDPEGNLRTQTPLPPLEAGPEPDPEATFLAWVGQKGKGPEQENRFSFTPDGQPRGLNIATELKHVRVGFTLQGPQGLQSSELHTGEVIGREIGFGPLPPPGTPATGTALQPVSFAGVAQYSLNDGAGRTVGAITTAVLEGRRFDMELTGAPGEPAFRFGFFGPIVFGSGCFGGVEGIFYGASGSVLRPPPGGHVITHFYVARLNDPEGKFRVESRRAHHSASQRTPDILPEDDPFSDMLRHKNAYVDKYINWRRGFRNCSEVIVPYIADVFNTHLHMGEFPGLAIDAQQLKAIFQRDIGPFDEETFQRYGGPAKGIFRTYDLATLQEIDVSALYSVWDPKILRINGRYAKKITGSNTRYFDPESLPDLSEGAVDLILNSYRQDVGLTSWVEIYQQGKRQRTSFAYKLPHQYEILWIVKDISQDGKLIENNVFMLSHEWKGLFMGKTCYFMVAFFFEIDFKECTIRLSGDRFWRSLYDEEAVHL